MNGRSGRIPEETRERRRSGRPSGLALRWAAMTAPVVVIMAAGEGTRMRSETPKLLHPICGRPMIAWPVSAALEAGAAKVIVVDSPARPLAEVVDGLNGGGKVVLSIQERPLGTGD